MFTGIITATSEVLETSKSKEGLTLKIRRPKGWDDIELGESICTGGVCLTVTSLEKDTYSTLLMPETLAVTAFGQKVPELVNLERSLLARDRFGGHFVQGHADGIGKVVSIDKSEDYRIEIEYPEENRKFVTHKGSITIDGVSLTIASCEANRLTVALIPHTLKHTTLRLLSDGSLVNLEFDMIAKHIASILELQSGKLA